MPVEGVVLPIAGFYITRKEIFKENLIFLGGSILSASFLPFFNSLRLSGDKIILKFLFFKNEKNYSDLETVFAAAILGSYCIAISFRNDYQVFCMLMNNKNNFLNLLHFLKKKGIPLSENAERLLSAGH